MASISTVDRLSNADAKSTFLSGSSYCAAMTEEQLDLLALELTSCELMKARRDMFVDQSHKGSIISSTDTTACTLGRSDPYTSYHASPCLELLTDHAHSIYHQIRLHTISLCNHLADEMFQRQKEETNQLLALQIQAVLEGTSSTIEQIHFQSALLKNHSHLLKEHQMDLVHIYEARKSEEASQSLLMKQHQIEIEQMYEARKMEQAEQDRLRKSREDSTMAMLQQQTNWMRSQQIDFRDMLKAKEEMLDEKVKERMKELRQMQEMIATAHSQIKPFSKIEAYVKMATDGLAIFKTVLNFFVTMNVVWICTSLSILNHAKKRLYGVVVLGFVAETAAILYVDSEFLISRGEMDLVQTIRFWTRGSLIAIWCASCLMSCFCPQNDADDQYATRMDDLLRSQLEFVSQLNASRAQAMVVGESQTLPSREYNIPTDKSTRKYHPVTKKRSRSRSAERRRFAQSYKPIVTPRRPPIDKSTFTNTSSVKKAMQRDAIKALKETQREHIDSGESSDELSSSQSDESSCIDCKSSKINRKRKFSETPSEPQSTVNDNRRD
ncbi:hypothetical protein ACHAXN_007017, partial [Cyclotella atomus]